MKDVLQYSEEELRNLSTDELNKLLHDAEFGEMLYNTNQIVAKTNINALYGALANKWFPLFNMEIARAITGNGRYYIHKMSKYIESGLSKLDPTAKYMLYNDTDSGYFSVKNFVDKAFADKPNATTTDKADFCDAFYKKVVDPLVQKSIDDFAYDLNAYNPKVIGCEREIIADKAVFTAKKKYFARVIDSEGVRYNPHKMKVMGLEIARSSTPPFVKDKLRESLMIILDSDTQNHLVEWVNDVQEQFAKEPLHRISRVTGVSNIDYDLDKSKAIPIGSRSALVHNRYIERNNLNAQYGFIAPGDKTKQIYLKLPNPVNSDVIAYTDDRFVEIFKDFIDYEKCFSKYFLNSLEIMVTSLKWDIVKPKETLDDW